MSSLTAPLDFYHSKCFTDDASAYGAESVLAAVFFGDGCPPPAFTLPSTVERQALGLRHSLWVPI